MNDNYDERDDELIAMAGKLSQEVAPKRDLWPAIEAVITTPQRSRWTPMFAQAAAVVLLVAGSSGVTYLAVTEQHENERVLTQVVPANMLFEKQASAANTPSDPGFRTLVVISRPNSTRSSNDSHQSRALKLKRTCRRSLMRLMKSMSR